MISNVIKTITLASILMITTASHASWGKSGWDKFKQCNRTQLVHFEGTIADAAIATPELSTLVTALSAAGLVDAVSAPGNLTVFAPTNDAFANIPASILDAILADTDLLTAVLLYHVVDGKVDPRKNYFKRNAETLYGQKIFFNRSAGNPTVNQSIINCQGVRTSNGTVWVIDSVLIPQF